MTDPINNQTDKECNYMEEEKLRKKVFIIQKFINFLIIIRSFIQQIPIELWTIILILLLILKIKKQGNVPTSIFTLVSICCSLLGQFLAIDYIITFSYIFAGLSYILSYTVYELPSSNKLVGIREEVLQKDLYLMELFPIKQNQKAKTKKIFWNHKLQIKKMMEYDLAKNSIYIALSKFLISTVAKRTVNLAQGDQQLTEQAIIFSHGRSATPLMYSQILINLSSFQSKKFSIFCVQHTEKRLTGETQVQKIKSYRERQVQTRAEQMVNSINYCKQKKQFVLMGHSYGGATTIQAYHSLPQQQKKKVSHIVLLDPWLFSLTDSKMIEQIQCPVLILANQLFLSNEDMYNRNLNFYNTHKQKTIYLIWKDGDHLHQTDLGFLVGNILGFVKHSELSLEMLNKNVKAIQMFIQDRQINEIKMRQSFKNDVLSADWKPINPYFQCS